MALLECHLFSDSLGLCTTVNVILPQPAKGQIGMASAGSDGRCPVLWLLHGMSDDHTIWLRRTSIERYVAPLGLAVIMPCVDRSFYLDMHQGPRYWTYLAEELPAILDAMLPLTRERDKTFAAGLSMGGYGAFLLGLRQPSRFAAVASLSGAVDVAGTTQATPKERGPEWLRIFGPLDQVAGSDKDLLHLSSELVRSDGPSPRFYQWCGTDDFLYPVNLGFRDHAANIGLDLTYEEGPGGHSWDRWDVQIQRVLEFFGYGAA